MSIWNNNSLVNVLDELDEHNHVILKIFILYENFLVICWKNLLEKIFFCLFLRILIDM